MGTSLTSTQGGKRTGLFSDKRPLYKPTKDYPEADFDKVRSDEARWCVNYEFARQSRLLCDKVEASRKMPALTPPQVRRGPLLKFIPFLAFHVEELPKTPWPKLPQERRKQIIAEIQQAINVTCEPASLRSWGSPAQAAKSGSF